MPSIFKPDKMHGEKEKGLEVGVSNNHSWYLYFVLCRVGEAASYS